MLTSSSPEILVRIPCGLALTSLVQAVRKPRGLLFPTQLCACLTRELSEDTALAFCRR